MELPQEERDNVSHSVREKTRRNSEPNRGTSRPRGVPLERRGDLRTRPDVNKRPIRFLDANRAGAQ